MVELFSHTVPRSTDLDCLARLHPGGLSHVCRRERGVLRSLACRTLGQVLLMALALRVRQIVALVCVDGEAKLALVTVSSSRFDNVCGLVWFFGSESGTGEVKWGWGWWRVSGVYLSHAHEMSGGSRQIMIIYYFLTEQ